MAFPNASQTDNFPSGSWSWGPLTVAWSLKNNDEIDVSAKVLGIDVDDLTGVIGPNDLKLSDQLSVLGIVTGNVTLEAKYSQGPATDGLWFTGQIKGPGFDTGSQTVRIISWP
jgi:hypothetical protein